MNEKTPARFPAQAAELPGPLFPAPPDSGLCCTVHDTVCICAPGCRCPCCPACPKPARTY